MKPCLKTILLILFLIIRTNSFAASADTIIINNAEYLYLEYDADNSQILNLRDNVDIEYGDMGIRSNSLRYNTNNSILYSDTSAEIISSDMRILTDNFEFKFKEDKNAIKNVKINFEKWLIDAKILEAYKITRGNTVKNKYIMHRGKFTTCDSEKPHYHFSAFKTTIVPGEYVKVYLPIFKIHNFPVIGFPYIYKRLDKQILKYEIGYRKREGVFALTDLLLDDNPPLTYSVLTDYYNYRGIGNGIKLGYDTELIRADFIGYYINEKPLVYDVNTGQYSKSGGERRERWKIGGNINANFQNNISLKAYGMVLSDNLIEKDYKERFSGLIINDYTSEIEVSQLYDDKVWHLAFEQKDYWYPNDNKFSSAYRLFPDFRFMYNKIYLKKYGAYYQPEVTAINYTYRNGDENFVYTLHNYLTKDLRFLKYINLSVTGGLKFYGVEKKIGNIETHEIKSDYVFNAQSLNVYKNLYNVFSYNFERNFYNINAPQNQKTSVSVNKLFWMQLYYWQRAQLYISTGYDFDDNNNFNSKKDRFDDFYLNYSFEINARNKISFEDMYNLQNKEISLLALSHNFNTENKSFGFSNGLNYIRAVNGDESHQFTSRINYNLLKNNIVDWRFYIGQTIDIDRRYLKSQNIDIIKDFHCMEGQLSYLKNGENDYSVFISFRIKAYPTYGLGMQYNYPNKSLRLKNKTSIR